MIRAHSRLEDIPQIQEQLEKIDYNQIRKIFLEPEVSKVSEINFGQIDYEGIIKYLVGERNFSQDRVQTSLNRLKKAFEKKSHTLEQWMD
jgi:flap endonuclease-1